MDITTFIENIGKVAGSFEVEFRRNLVYFIRTSESKLMLFNEQSYIPILQAKIEKRIETQKVLHKLATLYYSFTLSTVSKYEFNKTINDTATFQRIATHIKENEEELSDFIFSSVMKPNYIPDTLNETELKDLTRYLTSNTFITGEFVTLVLGNQMCGRLLWTAFNSYNPSANGKTFTQEIFDKCVKQISDRWKDTMGEAEFKIITNIDWMKKYSSSDQLQSYLKSDIDLEIGRLGYTENKNVEQPRSLFGPTTLYPDYYEHKYFGTRLVDWLNSSSGPKKYNLRSNINPSNRVSQRHSYADKMEGCVAEGTLVTLADGTTKEIQHIREGDRVLSENGVISICSDELVITPGIRYFYGINECEPCFTFDHALLTEEGWKSLDPDASNALNPHFNVSLLTERDTLLIVTGFFDNKPVFKKEAIDRITIKDIGEKGINGYDLHFREGKPSYFANGFLCLLNYPEMTLARIKKNMKSRMSHSDIEHFTTLVKSNRILFSKVFDSQIIDRFVNIDF